MGAEQVLYGSLPEAVKILGSGSGSGYGDGYGYGSGDGSGSGYGDGYGYGSGDGDGSGYGSGDGSGYGDGYGYGSGSGDGSGSGYGDGYGSGDGSGYGYGYGSGDYWAATISAFAKRFSAASAARLVELKTMGAKIAFWRSDAAGKPANGGSCAPVEPGTIHKLPGPLPQSCGRGALHATLIPPKWKGERCWLVALIGEVAGDDEKYWALEREIIGECL